MKMNTLAHEVSTPAERGDAQSILSEDELALVGGGTPVVNAL
jgi:hypothetical protein